SDPEAASVTDDGLVMGLREGPVMIHADVVGSAPLLRATASLIIADTTIIAEPGVRTGTLQTTSSYVLEGSFALSQEADVLTLALAESYRASSSLPGLYVYLSNNPNSTNGAYEIGVVTVFSGAHTYDIPASEVDLQQYAYVLYFCKPFNVKVGDGAFDN
ncbi:MAG: DM13 domain-containing protein, partial [Saprospiraceae bacterium]|nr:DM13 domain-containing protein [Saprospiraceae bacterium]